MCFAFRGEEKSNKYDRVLNAICNDIYDNNNNISIKNAVGENAFVVTDPITGTSRVEFAEPLTEQSKRLKKDFTPEKQLEIMEAYEWPIFPLGDTLYIFDKTGMFKKNVVTIKKPDSRKTTFFISHTQTKKVDWFVLDTLIARDTHTFVCFKTQSDPNSTYFYKISKKGFEDSSLKVKLEKSVMSSN